MNIIDLTQPLYDHMPVFPGDPEVRIEEIHTLGTHGWNLRSMTLTTHIGTHVNVPSHMVAGGNTLDQIPLNAFMGEASIYEPGNSSPSTGGLFFRDRNIDTPLMHEILQIKPTFIGLSAEYEFDIKIEKELLKNGVISFENLVNMEQLPMKFYFIGLPLHIRSGDGSPVRAVAKI